LREVQNYLYEQFSQSGIAVSEYSEPTQWQPHITLAYIDASLEFNEQSIEPVKFWVEYPQFTRSFYYQDVYHALD